MKFRSPRTCYGIVLAILKQDDYYGYALTQRVREVITVSESTMYPVLRRRSDGFVTTYDQPYQDVTVVNQITADGEAH